MSLNQVQSSKHKDPLKKIGQKIEKSRGTPLPFFKNIRSKIFFDFLTFNDVKCLGGAKNDVYRRRFFISSIYCVEKWIIKLMSFPPTPPGRKLPPLPVHLYQQIMQQTSVLIVFSVPQSDPIVET